MQYLEKYNFKTNSINNIDYFVKILEYTAATGITPTTITAGVDPVVIDFSIDNKYAPIRGSALELNLISVENMQFQSLYTADMFGYLVTVGTSATGNTIWSGYLASEVYNEPFDSLTDYPVNFSCNDGLALLDRMYYYNPTGGTYTGIASQWQMIIWILASTGLLPYWNSINVNISTTIPDITIASGETIFHKVFVNRANFYDEDGKSMTAREILESILAPYGAFIQIVNNEVIISDLSAFHQSNYWKKYIYYAGIYFVGQFLESKFQGDVSTIRISKAGANLTTIPAINEQVINYSPYNEVLVDSQEFSGEISTTVQGTSGYRWDETTYSKCGNFNKFNDARFVTIKGHDDINKSDSDTYLSLANRGASGISIVGNGHTASTDLSFEFNKYINIIPANYYLKVELDAYFRRTSDYNNSTYVPFVISNGIITSRLQIGNKKWQYGHNVDATWVADSDAKDFNLLFFNSDAGTGSPSPIEEQWKTCDRIKTNINGNIVHYNHIIPINTKQINTGIFSFKIYGYRCYDMDYNEVTIQECRIRNIKISICDINGNEYSASDKVYKGKFNKLVKESGDEIQLNHGTNIGDYPAERGGLMASSGGSYYWLHNFTRVGATAPLEKLLLRTIQANYENKTIQLDLNINKIDACGYLEYSNYFPSYPNRKFLITSCKTSLAKNNSEVTVQEIINENSTTII